MMAIAAREFAVAGAVVETNSGRMGLGDCVRARFPHHSEKPGILANAASTSAHIARPCPT